MNIETKRNQWKEGGWEDKTLSKTLQVETVSKTDDQKKDHMSWILKQRERNSLKGYLHVWQENILTKGTSVSCALCLADG